MELSDSIVPVAEKVEHSSSNTNGVGLIIENNDIYYYEQKTYNCSK